MGRMRSEGQRSRLQPGQMWSKEVEAHTSMACHWGLSRCTSSAAVDI